MALAYVVLPINTNLLFPIRALTEVVGSCIGNPAYPL